MGDRVGADFVGFKLTKWVEQVNSKRVEFCGVAFQEQGKCGTTGLWHHQLVKARILLKVVVDCD
mgnify:CR=1 FL=1|jgi:hypothetical protein